MHIRRTLNAQAVPALSQGWFSMKFLALFLAGFGLCLSALAVPAHADYIAATQAFENSPVCGSSDLGSDIDESRGNPEWKPVNGLTIDPNNPVLNDKPTILEGFVPFPPADETSDAQATSEVSEEDIVWNHYTHDFTFKIAPDPRYQNLLSSWNRFPGTSFANPGLSDFEFALFCASVGGSVQSDGTCVVPPEICPDLTTGTTCHHTDMEVEWDNASLMDEGHFQRIWGAAPEFVWPAVGDRVSAEGRWIFDCGHPGVPAAAAEKQYVKYSTEIHPPRALATFRLNHVALDSFPTARISAPNFPFPQSYLPVTGVPTTVPPNVSNSGPTNVPVTEADLFVTGNGGGANDLCMIMALNGSDCVFGHTTPVIAVNNYNYVFDIYPPGTDYLHQESNGTFQITRPVPDASLQWRTVDHFSELPTHTCGGSACQITDTVAPIFCPIDKDTAPVDIDPDKADTSCPPVPAQPTRLRVILPFKGNTNAKFFAQSVLLGWDDVPAPATLNRVVRTFTVTLHKLTVDENGESVIHNGDWRVFVNVGGQYRYISQLFDAKSDGTSLCNGANSLTDNGNGDCYLFDTTPWTVSVQDGTPIHVAVGGFESDSVDSDFCDQFPPSGDRCQPFKFGSLFDLATADDDRIGTYEFDLTEPHDYQWVMPDGSPRSFFQTQVTSKEGIQYTVEFVVAELPAATPPASAALSIGSPHYGQFVSSATPMTLGSTAPDAQGFQYRSYLPGGPLPTYGSSLPFPLHWTHVDLPAGMQSVPVFLTGPDGPNLLQYSAETFGQLLEPRHTATATLDNTPPVVTIVQPQPIPYLHSAVLTLNYSATDAGSGVQSVTPTMDTFATIGGHGLLSGQAINLLTELVLGAHTFSVTATDNVSNTGVSSVTFTIIVTPESIKADVTQFLNSGAIKNAGNANSLLAKLNAAAKARAKGNCATAANIYQAFINELNAQSGKGVDATAAQIMIADAQYLIAHCP
jgi:hypothetical protein